MKKITYFTLILLIFNSLAFAQKKTSLERANEYLSTKGEVVFTFKANSQSQFLELNKILSVSHRRVDQQALEVEAYANKVQFEKFLTYGLPFKVNVSDNEIPQERTKRTTTNSNSKIAASWDTTWDSYPKYSEYVAKLNYWATTYPNLCTLQNIGSTPNGRALYVLKISDNASSDETEPEFLYTSSMHGDEITGYPTMLRLIDYLLTNYGTDTEVTNIVNGTELFINPLANPDGSYKSVGNDIYNPGGATNTPTRGNANGVDLNRNYADPIAGIHDDGLAYQPETLAFMNFEATRNFVLSANFHGGAEVVNFPWDTSYTPSVAAFSYHPHDAYFIHVSTEYASLCQTADGNLNYMDDVFNTGQFPGTTNGAAWYSVYGGRQDNNNFFNHNKEVTIEVSALKTPSAANLPFFWDRNKQALLNYVKQASYGLQGVVSDASGNPIHAKVYVGGTTDGWGAWVETSATKGDYHKVQIAGTYNVVFEAPGYVTQTISATIANDATTTLNVTMVPTTSVPVAADATICNGQTAALTATGSGTINWYNSVNSTTPLASTASYSTPTLNANTSYFVESVVTPTNLGPATVSGAGKNNATVANQYLIFDCSAPTKLKSVLIGASTTGEILVELQNSSGTMLESKVVRLTASGNQDIALDFFLPAENGLRLVSREITFGLLTRANSGITYPLTNGTVTITGNSGAGIFFQFFNWKFEPIRSNRDEVFVTVSPSPTITGTTPGTGNGSNTVTLGATASSGTISWFATSSGGSALGTGTSFITPVLSATTTYYVETSNGTCTSARTAVTATVTSAGLNILGNSVLIANGDVTPSLTDFTDFGSVPSGNKFARSFVLKNNGGSSITFPASNAVTLSGADAGQFSITTSVIINPKTLTSNTYTIIDLSFNPTSVGLKTATVTVTLTTGTPTSYTFTIQGTGTSAVASDFTMTLLKPNSTFNAPYELFYAPDNYLWLTERVGKKINRVNPADGTVDLLLDLGAAVYRTGGQDGLLGMVLHPNFGKGTGEDYVYISYTYSTTGSTTDDTTRRTKLVRYTYSITGTDGSLSSPMVLIQGLSGSNDHNSGKLRIGPDGKLYYTIGDQGHNQSTTSNACKPINAQVLPTQGEITATDYSSYEGKILRMNLDGSIPTDNPILNSVKSHIYTYGHRNPQGLVFGKNGKLYSSEHGPKSDDEINLVQSGGNYGWPYINGFRDDKNYAYCNWSSIAGCNPAAFSEYTCGVGATSITESGWGGTFTPPLATFYTLDDGYNFTGGYLSWPTVAPSSTRIYEGMNAEIPDWNNSLITTALKRGEIYRSKLSADGTTIVGQSEALLYTQNRYRDIAFDPDGKTIYIITDSSGQTTGPSGSQPLAITNPGTILKFVYQPSLIACVAPVPDVTNLPDITDQCSVATLSAPTATNACAGTIIGTTNTVFPITAQGTTVVTWTYSYGNGNSVTQNQNVIIDDTVAPAMPTLADVTGQYSATPLTPTTTDLCAGTISGTTSTTFPISTQGTTVVTWTFNDGNGNSITANQNIIIDDTVAPAMPTLADVTGQCSVTPSTPTTTDLCAGVISGTTSTTFPITAQGTTIVTWTFDDGNGNSITANQNVIIDDTIAPVVPTLADVTGQCSTTPVTPTTTDACAGTISGTTLTVFPITAQGTTIVTWTFNDGNGNSVTANQNVILDDTVTPVMPTLADVTGQCSATPSTPTTTDLCAGVISGSTSTTFPITAQGTTIVTWTFNDGNGNSVTANQNVILDDTVTPVMPTLADVTGQCSATPSTPTTTDLCAGTISGTTSTTFPITAQGTTIVTWTFDDGNGNSITANQNVIIEDTVAPVMPTLADVTGQCSATPSTPTTTDLCAGTISGTTSTTFPITAQGTTIVTWTFNDGNGNSITANQNVIIDDTVAPICITKNITISVGTTITTNDIDNGSSDNCGINTMILSKYTFNTVGIETVTLTITDFKGNSSSETAQVTVENILGIENNVKNNQFVIYPMPFNSQINIDFPNSYSDDSVCVQIYSLNGKLIYNSKHLVSDQGIKIDNLSLYSDGGYLIYLLDENQKIILKKHILKKSN